MSEAAVNPLVPVTRYDPRTNLNPSTEYAVLKSGANSTLNNFPSSSYSTSQINFLPIVPNMDTIVGRNVQMTYYYQAVITGTTDQATLADCLGYNPITGSQGVGLIAPRKNPNAKVTNTLSATINNTSVSINLANNISVLENFNGDIEDELYDLSVSGQMGDFAQNYNDIYGSPMDPLQALSNAGYQQPRGGWADLEVIGTPTSTSMTIQWSSTEPLYLSPFSLEEAHTAGLFGVNNLTLNCVLGDLTRALSINVDSINPNVTIGSIVMSFYRAPEVLLTFIQPSNVSALPQTIPYSYSTVQEFQTDYGNPVDGGATFTMTSQNIQFTSIPKRVYIMARRSNATQTYATSDVFANISNVTVNFDVQSGILSSANEKQIYKMSAYNGYRKSFAESHRFGGTVACLDFAHDIMLQNPAETVGLGNVKKNFQCTVQFQNLNVNPINFTMFVIVVSDGLFTISRGTSKTQTGILNQQDILNSVDTTRIDANRPSNFYGGKFLSKGMKFLKEAAKIAPMVSSMGGSLVGGKMMPKAALLQRRKMLMGSGAGNRGSKYTKVYDSGEGDEY